MIYEDLSSSRSFKDSESHASQVPALKYTELKGHSTSL